VPDALAPISNKIQALIRMLSSDRDGEIVNAVRALNRLLKANGADIHAIADGVGHANGKKFTEADAAEIYRRGVEDGRREAEKNQDIGFRNVNVHDEPSWHEIACECQKHPDHLRDDREKQFFNDMVRRTIHGGKLSEKQASWLRSIYARVR
jgi:hypothetical protein